MKDAIDLEAMDIAFPTSPAKPPEGLEVPPSSVRVPLETANLLLERVIGIYSSRFAKVLEGRACLQRRGITNAALLDRHRVGYADGTLADLLPKDGPLKDELKSLGVLLDNGQERFLGCVVYPAYNQDGQLMTIMGHAAGDGPLQYRLLPGCPMGLWNSAVVKLYPENLIKAVAFLRQMRKPIKTARNGTEYLEVDLADIRFANELANELLGKSLDELSAPGRELLLQTESLVKAKVQKRVHEAEHGVDETTTFTRREVREFTSWANARVHRYLKELCDLEYLLVMSGRNGSSYH